MPNSSNSGSTVDPKPEGDSGLDCGEQSSGSKRRRAPNFTDKEIRILVKLVFTHIEIIESKKTDSETWRVKDIVWNNITESFNNCSGISKRTVEMIRQKYDSLKKIARKKEAKNREEEYKDEPSFIDMEDYEKELIRLLEPTTILLPETKFTHANIKTENSGLAQSLNMDLGDLRDDERFVITDDDMLWDLPSDTVNRPRMHLVKRQLEHLEREEERQIAEHKYRMKTEEIRRRYVLGQEKRARIEHRKKMELLELDIQLKQKATSETCDNSMNS